MCIRDSICIGHNFSACPGLRIECWDKYAGYSYFPQIVIGNNVSCNYRCHIGAVNKIVIGNNVLIGSQVLIIDHAHGEGNVDMFQAPIDRKLFSKGPIVIEDNVWIGGGAILLPGVTIGKNSVIGAGSIVTRSIPENCVAVGNPCRIIKHLNNI